MCLNFCHVLNNNNLNKDEIPTCIFDDPLTDLPWLKEKIDEVYQLINEGLKPSVKIYQCTYDNDKIGFLEDLGNVSFIYDCEGNVLCIMGGDAGETCEELAIDFANKRLIWEINERTTYPKEIETTNFPLSRYDCWANLDFNTVHVINSEQELGRYFTCKIYVDIDFANYSLLALNVKHCNIDSKVEKLSFQQLSADEFLFSVDVIPSLTANAAPLIVSVLVPKLPENATVELVVNIEKDTLKGEWNWINTYTAKQGIIENEYKSVIKIISRNKDATINYEIYVSDSLFSEGQCKFEVDERSTKWITGMKLSHFNPPSDDHWFLQFEDASGKPDENIMTLFSGNPDDEIYYYQKIKNE
jgi:hypothetical protein